jgi:ribokinase
VEVGILKAASHRYRGMVGTGGIGSGSFFRLTGNDTLGREESRGGRFLDRRDYCKLHIVSHYVKALLGEAFPVFPIGKVGADEPGRRLLREMEDAGLDLRFVQTVEGASTLFSFCFLYPDGTGGNLTTEDSASGRVEPGSILAAEGTMAGLGSVGIALALPEVPLAARRALLEAAARQGLFRAASFARAEMAEAREMGLLDMADLLAVNLEEAAMAAGDSGASPAPVERVVGALSRLHPNLQLSITAGAGGSWTWDGHGLVHDPAIPVHAEGTAGAGDAHLAGLLAGLAAGLTLPEAQQIATILAAASVTSPHAIHPGIDRAMLLSLCDARLSTAPRVRGLLGDGH